MDETYENLGFSVPLKRPPSEYFARQCYITMEPDEKLAGAMVKHLGADNFMWAADYPHSDGHHVPGPLRQSGEDHSADTQALDKKGIPEHGKGATKHQH